METMEVTQSSGIPDDSLTSMSASEFASKDTYDHLCSLVNVISSPLASRKLAKKVYKLVRKASTVEKNYFFIGIKDVQRAIRKGARGICILAGDVWPIDIYCHMPALCESLDMPYVFLPSQTHLSAAASKRQPILLALICPHESYKELYDTVHSQVSQLVDKI